MALTKIVTNALTDDAVTAAKIADGTIVAADLAANSVDSSELVNGSVDLAHMSVNSIDSDQYVDGSIDTAHIADNQVTLAKMAGIARGKLIYGDASGDPAALAVGSANQVLTHDGTDLSWSTITTVGALNAGSITSGFTSIDVGAGAITTTGVITGGTVEATTDTAAGDNAAIGYTSGEGLILTGQGSTNDVTIKNDADADVISIPTGATNVTVAGVVTATGFTIGSAAITEAELEILDGASLSTTELNYVDGVTSAIQTQMDTKTSTGKAIAMALIFGK